MQKRGSRVEMSEVSNTTYERILWSHFMTHDNERFATLGAIDLLDKLLRYLD